MGPNAAPPVPPMATPHPRFEFSNSTLSLSESNPPPPYPLNKRLVEFHLPPRQRRQPRRRPQPRRLEGIFGD
jgi:hypothetical protein